MADGTATTSGRFAWRFRVASLVVLIALAGVVNLFVPQLEAVIAKSPNPVVPESAPSTQALVTMGRAYGDSGALSVAFIVLVNENGLSPADQDYYRNLVGELRANHTNVAGVQEYLGTPALKAALVSKDGKAEYIPVGLRGAAGSAEATSDINFLCGGASTGMVGRFGMCGWRVGSGDLGRGGGER